MPSLISWLDASTEENAKMRELVKLFGTPETTDDLGMGQLRDVISNSLLPGTSVLHLGARYMLLVPRAYLTAHKNTKNPDELKKRAAETERQLIGRRRQTAPPSHSSCAQTLPPPRKERTPTTSGIQVFRSRRKASRSPKKTD